RAPTRNDRGALEECFGAAASGMLSSCPSRPPAEAPQSQIGSSRQGLSRSGACRWSIAMTNDTSAPIADERPGLKRAIGTPLLFAFIVGDTLGAGIYTLVGTMANDV